MPLHTFAVLAAVLRLPDTDSRIDLYPQILKVIPYSATQLYAYEAYKGLFKSEDGSIGVRGRLLAGASAGMTATLVSTLSSLNQEHRDSVTRLRDSTTQYVHGLPFDVAQNICNVTSADSI